MGIGADTIDLRLTVVNVGSGKISYKAKVFSAADRFLDTVPFNLFANGSGARSDTIAFKLSVIDVGLPVIAIKYTIGDMHFAFSGAPPVCDVSTPFEFHGKPNPPNQPKLQGLVLGPAIPQFQYQQPWNSFNDDPSTLQALGQRLAQLSGYVSSMGEAVRALKQHAQQQDAQNKKPVNSNFTEVRSGRVTSKHRITNPNDKSQFVDITQIDRLLFQNKQGYTIIWAR